MKALVLSILAGYGHIKAAEAICEGIEKVNNGRGEARNAVLLQNTHLGWFLNAAYVQMVRRCTVLWGFLYKNGLFSKKWIRRYLDERIKNEAERLISEFQPDVVVSTHPFIASGLSAIKDRRFKIVSCATDFDVHPIGIRKEIDLFVVPHNSVAEELIDRGIDRSKIKVTGLPISLKFSETKKENTDGKPTVLFIGGGYGLGHMESFLEPIAERRELFKVVIVTGKDDGLAKRVSHKIKALGLEGEVLGFVDNLDELMDRAVLMVGKPGGIQSTEAVAKQLPLIITEPIRGQEEKNAEVLTKEGAAIWPEDVGEAIETLLKSPERVDRMRECARRLARPFAVIEIAKAIEELIGADIQRC
jgi:processive 1,2-diacylglycerol beta-glucosyltransferase